MKLDISTKDVDEKIKDISKHAKATTNSAGALIYEIPVNDYYFEEYCKQLDQHIAYIDRVEHSRMGFVYSADDNKAVLCNTCSTPLVVPDKIELKAGRFTIPCKKCKENNSLKKISENVYIVLKK